MAVNPTTGTLYVTDVQGDLWEIAPSGAVTALGSQLFGTTELVYAPNTNLYAITSTGIIAINSSSGTPSTVLANVTGQGLAVDGSNNLYFLNTSLTPAEIDILPTINPVPRLYCGQQDGLVNGAPAVAEVSAPAALVADSQSPPNIYVADTDNNCVRQIDTNMNLNTLAGGVPGVLGLADGGPTTAQFQLPQGIAFDGHIVGRPVVAVADTGNGLVRVIDIGSGTTKTVLALCDPAFAPGTGSTARFANLTGLAIDASGNPLVLDSGSHLLLGVNQNSGAVTRVAGTGQRTFPVVTSTPSPTLALTSPLGSNVAQVTRGGTSIFGETEDHNIFELAGGILSFPTLQGLDNDEAPQGLATDQLGGWYIYTGTNKNEIYAISSNGLVPPVFTATCVAQNVPQPLNNGSLLNFCVQLVNGHPDFFISDGASLYELAESSADDAPGGAISKVTPRLISSKIGAITGVAVDNSKLFVALDNQVLEIDPTVQPATSTQLGVPSRTLEPDADGAPGVASFNSPQAIAVDPNTHILYVAEADRLRRIQQ